MQHQTTSRDGEHCRAITADRLILDGMLFRPEVVVPNLPVDVFLLIHGTGSNFSATGVLEAFTAEILARGTPVLRVNTRGHDRVASIPVDGGGMRNGGAAYEVIDECRHDIAAWLELLAARGLSRVALVGHSMGAVKAIYSQALEPHPNVKLLIAISPPRFCHANFMTHPKAQPFRDDFARASQLVGEGRGEEMISVKQPLPLELTAAGFIAKYGPHDDYDILRHLPKINVHTLVIIGEESVATSPAFNGLPETLERATASQSTINLCLQPGADTNYTQCLDAPYVQTSWWLIWLNPQINTRPITQSEFAFLCRVSEMAAVDLKMLGLSEESIVEPLLDGGMGSLRFPLRAEDPVERRLGGSNIQGAFDDKDDMAVQFWVNVDKNGQLFELDIWKCDFNPLIRLPTDADVVYVMRPGEDEANFFQRVRPDKE